MIRNVLGTVALSLVGLHAIAQTDGVLINYTGATRDNSAVLEASSIEQGVLVPRMTEAQRNAIVSPATSLLIFQTNNTPGYYFNSGTPGSPVWQRLFAGSGSPVTGSGAATRVAFWDGPNSLSSNANLYWDNGNSRLGIGTASPSETLHVNGAVRGNQAGAVRISTGTGYVDVGPMNTSWSHFQTDRPRFYFQKGITVDEGLIGSYDEDLSLQTSGTTRISVLNSTGFVGIGQTAPGSQLHVGTTGWSANQLHFSSGWAIAGYHATIGSGYTGIAASGIMLGTPHVPYRASFGAKVRYASDQAATHYWDLGINAEAGGAIDRFDLNRNNVNLVSVLSNGNVGIGTTGAGSKMEVVGDALTLSGSNLDMNRDGFARHGISWYSKTYPSWSTYMAQAGQTSVGPHGDLTAPSGVYVNSWAMRSYIENVGGYGWTFESAANTTTPAVRFEIRASDGLFHAYGAGIVDGTLTIGGGSPAANRVLISSNAAGLASWADQSTLAANYANLTGIPIRTSWVGVHRNFVAEQLSWKNYGNNHTIFDASAGTSPQGTAVNNTDAQVAWTATYPTLMGWNGTNTYGVRVDAARQADRAYYLRSPYPYNINITDGTTAATLSEPNSLTSVNMHASHGLFGSWATTLTMSGYERYGAYQISGNYNAAVPEIAIRNYVQSTSTWNSWVRLITTANLGSNAIQNQNASAQSANYWINGNGTVGGFVSITSASVGAGNLRFSAANPYITASSYFVAPGGAYFNSGTVYTEAAIQARGGINNDAGSFGGNVSITDDLRIQGVVTGIQGSYPTNNAIRLTPNFHLNTAAGYATIINWDNGAVGGGTQQFRVGNGQGTDQFYVRADGGTFGRVWYDLDDTGYLLDANSTSNSALRIRGGALHGPNPTWGSYLLVGGDGRNGYIDNANTASVSSTNGNLHADAASGRDMYLNYYDGNNIFFGRGNNSTRATLDGNGLYLYDGWLRTHGAAGLYFQDYGGGWHMTDGTWIRAYNSKPVYVNTTMQARYVNWGDNTTYANSGYLSGYMEGWSVSDGHRINPMNYDYGTTGWGYIGQPSRDWYYMYADNFTNTSGREKKKDITPLDESLYEYVMSDIDKVKPTFYRYKGETADFVEGHETKYKPQLTLGIILDESPDYIQDNAFSGVNIYSAAVLALTGVKYNREKIKDLENRIYGHTEEFGESESGEWIAFGDEFASSCDGRRPVVMVTPTSQHDGSYYLSEVTAHGFKVMANATMTFSWHAATPRTRAKEQKPRTAIPATLEAQLKVTQDQKRLLQEYFEKDNAKSTETYEKNMEVWKNTMPDVYESAVNDNERAKALYKMYEFDLPTTQTVPSKYVRKSKESGNPDEHPQLSETKAPEAQGTATEETPFTPTEVKDPKDAENYHFKVEDASPQGDVPTREIHSEGIKNP